ncbi:MAG: GNAT family N-acetyltransferase [Acidobacteria bacterium]|nr:GNAT family N-acetyltransferase [Acidobacteriota bacterium]
MSKSPFDNPVFAAQPAAQLLGPFPHAPFLRAWREHFPAGDLVVLANNDSLVPLVFEDGRVSFAGHRDVTDYHSPLGPTAVDLLADWIGALPRGTSLVFDSLPDEAAAVVMKAIEATGLTPTKRIHEVAAVMTLGDSRDEWLATLSKKQRHEVRRKRRRFAEAFGEPRLVTVSGADAVATFAKMHRNTIGEKGVFMTEQMAAFFHGLHADSGATITTLLGADERPAAMAFGFFESDAYYLYNSALEPSFAEGAPGVVLLDLLIEHVIEMGVHRFDFLKGDEPYKFRMGATARDLYEVEAAT